MIPFLTPCNSSPPCKKTFRHCESDCLWRSQRKLQANPNRWEAPTASSHPLHCPPPLQTDPRQQSRRWQHHTWSRSRGEKILMATSQCSSERNLSDANIQPRCFAKEYNFICMQCNTAKIPVCWRRSAHTKPLWNHSTVARETWCAVQFFKSEHTWQKHHPFSTTPPFLFCPRELNHLHPNSSSERKQINHLVKLCRRRTGSLWRRIYCQYRYFQSYTYT